MSMKKTDQKVTLLMPKRGTGNPPLVKDSPEIQTVNNEREIADTVADSVLELLEEKRLLHNDIGSKRPTNYGEAISSYRAKQALCGGGSIIVEHPVVRYLEKGGYPKGGMALVGEFPGFDSKEYKDMLLLATASLHGIGVRIQSLVELKKLNASDNLTTIDTSDSLNPEEKEASKNLSRYVGETDGYFSPVNMPVLKGGILHYYKWGPAKTNKTPGIYDPERKMGFFRRRMVRLSVFEAMNKLKNGKPIAIIKKDGTDLRP